MNIHCCMLEDEMLGSIVGGYGIYKPNEWCQVCEMNGDWPCLRPSGSYFPCAPCMRLEDKSGQFVYPMDDF